MQPDVNFACMVRSSTTSIIHLEVPNESFVLSFARRLPILTILFTPIAQSDEKVLESPERLSETKPIIG